MNADWVKTDNLTVPLDNPDTVSFTNKKDKKIHQLKDFGQIMQIVRNVYSNKETLHFPEIRRILLFLSDF